MRSEKFKPTGFDTEFKVSELSWDEQMRLMDEGFSIRKLMSMSCGLELNDPIWKRLDRKQGKELLLKVNKINETKSEEDFQKPPKEEVK